jgi:O-antigen/teichoic acid export membrane protein
MIGIQSGLASSFSNLQQRFKKGSFSRNVGTMVTWNLLAQSLGLLSTPIITRLYAPEDFGIMTLFASLIALFSTVASLRYESAIIISKKNSEAINVFGLCVSLTTLFTMFMSVLIFCFADVIAREYAIETKGLLWLIPCGFFFTGLKLDLNYWFSRMKQFSLIAVSEILQPITSAAVKIIAGLLCGSTAFWLVFGNLAGTIAVFFCLFISFQSNYFTDFIKHINKTQILHVSKEYNNFPKYSVFTALLNSASQNLPAFLFVYFFSSEVAGLYGLAATILRKPVTIISNSIRKVFLQKAASTVNQSKSLKEDLKKITIALILIGIIPFGIVTIAGEELFSLVFGSEWRNAGLYAQVLSPWLFLLFINPPATQVYIVKQKLFFNLCFDLVLICARTAAISVAACFSGNPLVAVAMFSGAGFLANLYKIVYAFKIAELNDANI